jgi:hypothetical protein
MPANSTVHFDVALTNLSIAYRNGQYVAPIIAPEVLVRKQSDRYFIHDAQREAFRSTHDGRAPGAEANEVDFQLSTDTYFCDGHALQSVLPDEERLNSDTPLRPEVDRVEFLTEKIMLNHEIAAANLLTNESLVPHSDLLGGSDQWSDDSSEPLDAIEEGRAAILAATQQLPNTLVLPFAVYSQLRNHPKVVERVKYAGHGNVGTKVLSDLLDVENVLVARAMRNTSSPGQAPVLSPVWGKDALLLYVPQRPALKSIAPILTFQWSDAPASVRGVSVQSWREERRCSTLLRAQKYYDVKLVASGAAYLFKSAVA